MLVPAVAALGALFCLWHLPLCLALEVTWRDGLRFGAGFAPVDARAAMARAAEAARTGGRARGSRSGRRFLRGLVRRLRVDEIRVEGTICLGDAAATALGCGAAAALLGGLGSRADRAWVDVRPDFGVQPGLALRGMVTVRAGHIIVAAAGSGLERLQAWDSPYGLARPETGKPRCVEPLRGI